MLACRASNSWNLLASQENLLVPEYHTLSGTRPRAFDPWPVRRASPTFSYGIPPPPPPPRVLKQGRWLSNAPHPQMKFLRGVSVRWYSSLPSASMKVMFKCWVDALVTANPPFSAEKNSELPGGTLPLCALLPFAKLAFPLTKYSTVEFFSLRCWKNEICEQSFINCLNPGEWCDRILWNKEGWRLQYYSNREVKIFALWYYCCGVPVCCCCLFSGLFLLIASARELCRLWIIGKKVWSHFPPGHCMFELNLTSQFCDCYGSFSCKSHCAGCIWCRASHQPLQPHLGLLRSALHSYYPMGNVISWWTLCGQFMRTVIHIRGWSWS